MEINQNQVRTRRRGGSVLHLTCGSSSPAMGPDNQPKNSTKRHTCGPSNVTDWVWPWPADALYLLEHGLYQLRQKTCRPQQHMHIAAINLCWLQIRFETEHAGALHSENTGEALSTKLGCGTETAKESKAVKSEVSRSFPSKGWRD